MTRQTLDRSGRNPLNQAGFFIYKRSRFTKLFKKGVALTLVFTFGYSQFVWAIDVRQMLADAKASFALEDQDRLASTTTAGTLTQSQTQQQTAVDQQQALQDLQSLNFSLTTQNGDILNYVGDKLSEVKRPDGTKLNNIQLDANGSIASADLRLSDGSVQVYQNGAVLGYETPDGTQVIYQDGRIQKTVSKDGTETLYSYIKDSTGAVIETDLDNPTKHTRYDAQGKLKEVYDKASGTTTTYLGGIIQKIQKADGLVVQFSNTPLDGGVILTPQIASYAPITDAFGNVYSFQSGNIVQIALTDGSVMSNFAWNTDNSLNTATITDVSGKQSLLSNFVWNPDKSLQAFTLTDGSGTQCFYSAGSVIQIKTPDGSTLTGLVWNPDNSLASAVLTDASGTQFFYTNGSVTQIKLTDGTLFQDIVWGSDNKMKDATMVLPGGLKFIYQNKVLIQSFDASGVATSFSYPTRKIVAASAGITYEYLSDKTPTKTTWADGSVTQYLTQGSYKGLRDTDVSAAGVTYQYEYKTASGVTSVEKREVLGTTYNTAAIQGQSNISNSTNPFLKFSALFPGDRSIDQAVTAGATYGSGNNARTLTVNLLSGAGSTYVFNGTSAALGVTLSKDTLYNVEIRWETGRVAIYVYNALSPRPSTPTKTISDRAWNPKFTVTSTNAPVTLDPTSSGTYVTTAKLSDKTSAYQPSSPYEKVNFRFISSATSNTVTLTAKQTKTGNITRTLTAAFSFGKWTLTRSDADSSTGKTTNTTSTLAQTLTAGTDYVAELRIEGTSANLYVYPKGQVRPSTPLASMAAYSVSTQISADLTNAVSQGMILKNLSQPALSTVQAQTLLAQTDTIQNSTLTQKPLGVYSQKSVYLSKPDPQAIADSFQADFKSSFEYSSVTYDSDGRLKQAVAWDGTTLSFTAGLLQSVRDAAGNETTFNFSQSTLANVTGTEIVRNNLSSKYDGEGRLSEVSLQGLTIHYQSGGSTIDSIEKSDGTELHGMTFDASGAIQSATIDTPDGEERVYVNGKLTSVTRPDLTKLFYVDEKLTRLLTPDKLTYDFSYVPDAIQATLDVSSVPDALTPVQMQYDTSFNLQKVVRQNNQIINYLNNQIREIDVPNAAPQVFDYVKDPGGNVLSYTVTQGNVQTFYDANNNPTKAVISPITDNPHTLEVLYQYGKIRAINKDGVLTFQYTYSFDAGGAELVNIEDLEEKTLKVYEDGNLLTSFDEDTSVLSSYGYAGGQVSQVQVTRLGRLLHTYHYTYSGDQSVVTDEEGVMRTYGADKKLLSLEKDGQKFAYSYHTVKDTAPSSYADNILPISTYDTSARDEWNGQSLWHEETWDGTALTAWSVAGLEYSVNLEAAGDLEMTFETINPYQTPLPPGYPGFQLEIDVDGAGQGVFTVKANPAAWENAEILLKNLTAGSHTLRMKWINDAYEPGVYDANFKFRNLKLTHKVPVYSDLEIVQEKLIEKKLSDGSTAHYDDAGRTASIDLPDGSKITDIVLDANHNIARAAIALPSGVGEVFDQNSLLEEIEPDGTGFYFDGGRISKVTNTQGPQLDYSYDKDVNGNVLAIWVKKDNQTNLKYDPSGNLIGLKVDGVPTPSQVAASAQHTYTGGSGGPYSDDGNFNTAQTAGFGGGTGNSSVSLMSEQDFTVPSVITSMTYRLTADGSSNGSTNNGSWATSYLQVKDALTGQWVTVPETYLTQSHSNGGGGGSTAYADTANPSVVNKVIANILGIRACAAVGAYNNGSGSYGGSAYIYELGYTLADQSYFNFNTQKNAQGEVSGYSFSGYPGSVGFDAQGNFTPGDSGTLNQAAQPLDKAVLSYISTPYLGRLNQTAPASLGTWFSAAQDAVDPQRVISQEYSARGTLETQTKADQTVTIFENNKPKEVLDENGLLLIQYSYNPDGNPSRVYLKNARDTLPDEVLKAKQNIEDQRAAELRALAAQKSLAYQSIQSQAAAQRLILQSQLDNLQGQYDGIAGSSVYGSRARSAKADALGQIGGTIGQIISGMTGISSQEADAYAGLDVQVKQVSDKIETDAQTAFAQLDTQEANLKKEILRQEVSPIVYDYYRRILGRDPSSSEYDYWVSKIDYDSGQFIVGDNVSTVIQPTASAHFDGTGDYLSVPDSTDWNFGTGDFTIDTWVKFDSFPASGYPTIWSQGSNGTNYSNFFWYQNAWHFYSFVGNAFNIALSAPDSIATGAWYHIALVRSGNNISFYRDGVLKGSVTTTAAFPDYSGPLTLGGLYTGSTDWGYYLNGRIDEFRVSKGIARWTANFTPSTMIYTPDGPTKLLLRFGQSGAAFFQDVSSAHYAVTPYGNTSVDATQYKVQQSITVHTPVTQDIAKTLNDYLNALPELSERQAYVNNVKQSVGSAVNSYLGMSQADQQAFAASLGLSPNELINLTASDAQKILTWLNSRSLHFGQSAFLSLESLLDQKGITYTREDLATKCILVDILTGVISPLDDGDLVISVYSLSKVAALYGLTLTGANLSWDDLLALYQNSPTSRVIAHINGNHYVVITGITSDSITYIDPGIGADKQNESLAVTREGFLKAWKGKVTLEQTKGQYIASFQHKVLSASQIQNIRGAFWGSLLNLIGWVVSFTPLAFLTVPLQIAALVTSIAQGDWISGLSSIVSLGFSGFANSVQNILKGAFQSFANSIGPLGQVLQGVGSFFGSVFNVVQGLFGNISNFFSGIKGAFNATSGIASQLIDTAVGIGLNFGVSKGLEAVGVNPGISGFFGSLASGAVIGAMEPKTVNLNNQVVTQAQNIQSSIMQSVVLGQVGSLGLELHLDPAFSDIVGLSLAAIQGQAITNSGTTLEAAFSDIKPELTSSLTRYGVNKLGTSLGLDPRISGLIGAPISAGIVTTFDAERSAGVDIINSVQAGMIQGAIAYGLSFTGTQSAILGSLMSRDITNNLALSIGREGLFNTVFDILGKTALNMVNVVGGVAKTVFEGVTSFGATVQQKGLSGALDSFLEFIFNRQTQESIVQKGGVQAMLSTSPRTTTVLSNGQTVQELKINDGSSLYFDDQNNLIGKKEDGIIQIGSFATDLTGKFGLQEGNIYGMASGDTILSADIKDGQLVSIKIDSPDGTLLQVDPEKSNTPIFIEGPKPQQPNPTFDFWRSLFKLLPYGLSLFINEGIASAAEIGISSVPSTVVGATQKILYVLVNGIGNQQVNASIPPDYMNNLAQDLVALSNDDFQTNRDIIITPIYQGDNKASDVFHWIQQIQSPIALGTEALKIASDIDNHFVLAPQDKTRPIVAMGYSGGLVPLIEAIKVKSYNVETLVGVGAATTLLANIPTNYINEILAFIQQGAIGLAAELIRQQPDGIPSLTGTSVKRVLNIWGTNDILTKYGIAGKRDSIAGIPALNIEIAEATHYDYTKRANETDPVKKAFNDKVSAIVDQLILRANDQVKLNDFLLQNAVLGGDGVYRITP